MQETEEELQNRFEEAFRDHVPAYSPEHSDGDCHNCGYEFDSDEWDVRHLANPQVPCESWYYTCPRCDEETVTIGT